MIDWLAIALMTFSVIADLGAIGLARTTKRMGKYIRERGQMHQQRLEQLMAAEAKVVDLEAKLQALKEEKIPSEVCHAGNKSSF